MLINELRMIVKEEDKMLSCAEIHSIDLFNNEFLRVVEYDVNMDPVLERVNLDNVIILLSTGKKDDNGELIFVGDVLEVQAYFQSTPQGSGYTHSRTDTVISLEYFFTEIYPNADSYEIVGNVCDDKVKAKEVLASM